MSKTCNQFRYKKLLCLRSSLARLRVSLSCLTQTYAMTPCMVLRRASITLTPRKARRYAAVETGIKTGRASRLGGETRCLSHCGYAAWLGGIVPRARPVQLWRTHWTAQPTIRCPAGAREPGRGLDSSTWPSGRGALCPSGSRA